MDIILVSSQRFKIKLTHNHKRSLEAKEQRYLRNIERKQLLSSAIWIYDGFDGGWSETVWSYREAFKDKSCIVTARIQNIDDGLVLLDECGRGWFQK